MAQPDIEKLSLSKSRHFILFLTSRHDINFTDPNSISEEIYTSDKKGDDETGNGTEEKPFKTVLQAMRHAGKEPFPTIYVDAKNEGNTYEVAAKSQLKKVQKLWVRENYKAADKAKAEDESSDKRQQNMDEAKKIEIKVDPSLPKAKVVKICESKLISLSVLLGGQLEILGLHINLALNL